MSLEQIAQDVGLAPGWSVRSAMYNHEIAAGHGKEKFLEAIFKLQEEGYAGTQVIVKAGALDTKGKILNNAPSKTFVVPNPDTGGEVSYIEVMPYQAQPVPVSGYGYRPGLGYVPMQQPNQDISTILANALSGLEARFTQKFSEQSIANQEALSQERIKREQDRLDMERKEHERKLEELKKKEEELSEKEAEFFEKQKKVLGGVGTAIPALGDMILEWTDEWRGKKRGKDKEEKEEDKKPEKKYKDDDDTDEDFGEPGNTAGLKDTDPDEDPDEDENLSGFENAAKKMTKEEREAMIGMLMDIDVEGDDDPEPAQKPDDTLYCHLKTCCICGAPIPKYPISVTKCETCLNNPQQ
ncbi:MAG: hypothetical protein KJ607_03200 [Bacteroidetes bacterium]|nr:hypothetical protein [Bacteroidota bacterium]